MLGVDVTTTLAGSGIVALFVAAVTLIGLLLRIWMRMVSSSMDREQVLAERVDAAQQEANRARLEAIECRKEADQLREDHATCTRHLAIVRRVLQDHGLTVPETWTE